MAKGIIARKIGMTQIFDEEGKSIPVTVLRAGPCVVTQVRTMENDKYAAFQLGFEKIRAKLKSKAEQGHLKTKNLEMFRILREFRNTGWDFQTGQEIKADIFSRGDIVKASGVSKGKGFQGTIKRHGFGGGRAAHGSKFHRAPGSIGSSAYPSRVFKGTKLPGHTGSTMITVGNLEIVEVDVVHNLIMIRGAVPGPRTSLVRIEAQR